MHQDYEFIVVMVVFLFSQQRCFKQKYNITFLTLGFLGRELMEATAQLVKLHIILGKQKVFLVNFLLTQRCSKNCFQKQLLTLPPNLIRMTAPR